MKWGSDQVFQDLKYIFYLEFPPQIEAYIFVSSTEKKNQNNNKKTPELYFSRQEGREERLEKEAVI